MVRTAPSRDIAARRGREPIRIDMNYGITLDTSSSDAASETHGVLDVAASTALSQSGLSFAWAC